ncbi:MAG: Hsp20/alpha crystallin family protein [Gemmatimonadetes bacterium]|nr:Hsp20/alpha crystallin family protein [Gemmatimonadota bacterium]
MTTSKLIRRPAWANMPLADAFPMRNRMRAFFDDPFFRLMEEPLTDDALPEAIGWVPMVDVAETTDEYLFTAELPGMKREDVKIAWEQGVLTLRGEKIREVKKDEGRKFHLFERTYGAFQRSFTLPEQVLPDKIIAEMKDGVLLIHVPKAPEAKAAARRIKVKVN